MIRNFDIAFSRWLWKNESADEFNCLIEECKIWQIKCI